MDGRLKLELVNMETRTAKCLIACCWYTRRPVLLLVLLSVDCDHENACVRSLLTKPWLTAGSSGTVLTEVTAIATTLVRRCESARPAVNPVTQCILLLPGSRSRTIDLLNDLLV